ncbi:hypothetical protein [Mesorhizobium sp. KR9-304]|uniref:hypothetical protein n=1 Tax=Mesorhizobium sp. KR9-304 TaxID=3156614 RepID=UPI0032B334F1
MTKYQAALRKLAFSTILLAIPLDLALAQDASAVADRLKALSAKQGIDIGWSKVTGDASNMVIEGFSARAAGESDAFEIGNVTLSDVTEQNGGYLVGRLTTAPFSMAEDGMEIDISPFVVEGLSIPADSTDPMSSITMYRNASLDNLSVKIAGKTAFALDGMAFQAAPPEGGQPMTFSGAIEKFSTDLTVISDPQVRSYFDALGYSQLDGFINLAGSWQPADGRWLVSRYDIAINDVGTLGMTVDVSGFTPGVLQKLNETSARMAETPDGTDTADQKELLRQLENATFNGASLRFTDDSLTNRAVGMVAAQQRAKPADVITMAKAALPLAMMQFQMGELAGAISPAINAFLDDPRNVEIVLAPPSPVTFGRISEVSTATPGDSAATTNALWTLLGVKVDANQ